MHSQKKKKKKVLCRHETQLCSAWAVGFPLLPAPLDSYQKDWKLSIPNEKQNIFIIKFEMFKCNWLLADFKVCLSDPHAAKPMRYKQWWSDAGWGWCYMWLYQNLHWVGLQLSPRLLIPPEHREAISAVREWGQLLICSFLLSSDESSVENIGYTAVSCWHLCH